MYFFNWPYTSIVHYRGAFKAVPQWTIALIALAIVLTVNMITVKLPGEMEFWASPSSPTSVASCRPACCGW
jgi:L-asparagine permease